ncbi:phytanoyl-CoA dioxygenase family protein [Streptomyces sp. NPDC017993]|uniref:phytanoyl-CoA dioxygenase family protein n=1 Tax=Streptomyces sp. NPDC017993 TaxID=3365027 RepID=UPI0037AD074E
MQIMVAVSGFTAKNGGTLVASASHLWDEERAPRPTEMKAGSALIWVGSTHHGGGQSATSHEYRFGLSMSYDLAFLRPEENPYLAYTLNQIRSFPEGIQRTLDRSSEHYAGWDEVGGHMSDPMELLSRDD